MQALNFHCDYFLILVQIEERGKLVSSIKSSTIYIEMDSASSKESDSHVQSVSQGSTSGELDRNYSIDTATEKSDQSSKVEVSVSPSSSVYTRESEKSSPEEHSMAEALGLSREITSEETCSKIMSPSLSRATELYVTKEDLEDVKKENVKAANAAEDAAPGEGIKDSPPLAGANVMNVILVAAECAPWSKTGYNFLLYYGNCILKCPSNILGNPVWFSYFVAGPLADRFLVSESCT